MEKFTTFREVWDECDSLSQAEKDEIMLKVDLIRKVVEAREKKGLSQQALAKICGVKQPFIARLETGNTDPQLTTLLKILKPLGYKLVVVPESCVVDCSA
jgi:predicted transcriptional regulator